MGKIKSFYKIGLIKIESEKKKLEHRYRREIKNGCKVYVVNLVKLDNYDDTVKLEEHMIKNAEAENIEESKILRLDRREKTTNKGDLAEYAYYFSGMTEAFRTPCRFDQLILRLDQNFEQNPPVYYQSDFWDSEERRDW